MTQRGCLLIADIGGYTNFLTAVELEHSTDILADLIGAIVAQAEGAFKLAKLEGDAVFCHAPGGSLDGPAFVTLVESCYFAFAERLRDIARASTCDCGACRLTPSLNLKFVAHAGEYALHTVAGNVELVGPEVITVHRLLKNHVVEATGKRGYAFLSQQCLEHLALDPEDYGLVPHTEQYDDVGDVPGYVLDLEEAWRQHEAEQRVYVTTEDAIFASTAVLPGTPAVLWDYFNAPAKMRRWGADDMTTKTKGARGVGTVNHCVHGSATMVKQVLDWKPFRYMTESNRRGPFTLESTVELTPLEGGRTEVEFRVRPAGNAIQRVVIKRMATPQLRRDWTHGLDRLRQALAEDGVGGEAGEPEAAGVASAT